MKKILGVTALLAAAIAGGAVLIHGNSREPVVPASESTHGTYLLTGDELEVDSSGPVTITVVTGPPGEVVVDRRLRWTGPKRHSESWNEHRMTIDYECGGGDCGAGSMNRPLQRPRPVPPGVPYHQYARAVPPLRQQPQQ
ncbi:hypothetical protein [Nonomuraea sediminis]|uniref:hypothetical protein n=1 Tax=Nonomuraea sediminis TaxID=2835864 RepID=UPI001BDC85F1|nr:hypothetical protein [Nonomuraea sediminis]